MNEGFWRDRRVFVTGATGLVGTWTVKRLLAAAADVVCLTRDWVPQSEFVRAGLADHCNMVHGDLSDRALLERVLGDYEVRAVLHLAAQTIVGVANRNPVNTFETNIAGTWNLLEACRRSPLVEQIVIASSDKAYGPQPRLPYEEDMPLKACHPYDVSKACADLLAATYAHTYGLPVCITRCGNFYGGGDLNWNRLVPGTIRSVLRGERPVIRSDGSYIRDYFYVKDGAIAYMHLAEMLAERPALRGEAFNFSNELQMSVLDMTRQILDLMGKREELPPIILNEAKNEIVHQYLSAAKARKELNWTPAYSLEEGLRETIAWYAALLGGPAGSRERVRDTGERTGRP